MAASWKQRKAYYKQKNSMVEIIYLSLPLLYSSLLVKVIMII